MTSYMVGLGSSLAEGEQRLSQVIEHFKSLSFLECLSHSSIYKTPPMGGVVFSYFYNAAIYIKSDLFPHILLQELMALESFYGRIRYQKNGARTLDLDILWAEGLTFDSDDLQIPHPGLWQRDFAFIPAIECFKQAQHSIPREFRLHKALFLDVKLEKLKP